ncbi:MAG: DUF1993 family protein [Tateyamaria sp.]|jgi:hypothetical protein|uniref:DUF1993 family protein n=1 Tax=Tateyamaria sp. TaxID=1929288 RepID=UPI0032DD0AD5
MDFFDATVPPLKRLAKTVPRLIARLETEDPISARLTPDSFTAGEHFCCALGFVARTILPLVGRDIPELPFDNDPGLIVALSEDMTFLLQSVSRHDFHDAEHREITHNAGEATLTQNGKDYALLFALPNAQFHLTLGYATLRHKGANVGKGDLDGFHLYTSTPTHH